MSADPARTPSRNILSGKSIVGLPLANDDVLKYDSILDSFVYGSIPPQSIDFSDLTGSLANSQVPNNELTATKLASYLFSKLTDQIALAQIPDNLITDAKIISLAFAKLTGSIALGQIPNALITLEKLNQDGAVLNDVVTWNGAKWVAQAPTGGGGLSGNIAFLMKKEFDTDRLSAQGSASVVGAFVTLTAPVGKDLYLAKAKVIFFIEVTSGAAYQDKVELRANGVVIETATASVVAGPSDEGSPTFEYEFVNIGDKITAGQTFTLHAVTLSAVSGVVGVLEGVQVATGGDPTA